MAKTASKRAQTVGIDRNAGREAELFASVMVFVDKFRISAVKCSDYHDLDQRNSYTAP